MTLSKVEEILARSLPSNVQAEQMLLGAIIINPDLLNQVNEFLKPEHFYNDLHRAIYNSIEILAQKSLNASAVVLKSMLDKEPLFNQFGGIDYLNKLATISMMVINPRDYGRVIYDLAVRRNLITIGEKIVNVAYDSKLDNDSTSQIEWAENKLYHLAREGINDRGFVKLKGPIDEAVASINRAMKSPDHVIGISTGLKDLDMKLFGFHNSDLVIIAGRPSMGKTAFAINFALNACKSLLAKNKDNELKPSVGFFSLEMSSEQLASRLLSMYTKIDAGALRSGKVNEEYYNQIMRAAIEISELPFFIDDTPALSISAIRARARNLSRKANLGILFVDYLQLVKGSGRTDNRVIEISEITQGLKALAKELNIPVIALAQLSRAVEQREDKRPMLSDLRESGSIEQDADVVMFLHREEYYLTRKQPAAGDAMYAEWQAKLEKVHNVTDIMIAKHRNGSVGTVPVFYDTSYSKISDLVKLNR